MRPSDRARYSGCRTRPSATNNREHRIRVLRTLPIVGLDQSLFISHGLSSKDQLVRWRALDIRLRYHTLHARTILRDISAEIFWDARSFPSRTSPRYPSSAMLKHLKAKLSQAVSEFPVTNGIRVCPWLIWLASCVHRRLNGGALVTFLNVYLGSQERATECIILSNAYLSTRFALRTTANQIKKCGGITDIFFHSKKPIWMECLKL